MGGRECLGRQSPARQNRYLFGDCTADTDHRGVDPAYAMDRPVKPGSLEKADRRPRIKASPDVE
jgi:hypothetical protein